jgi:hypothetical protein
LSQVSVVLSEDLNPGAVIEGVRFLDPFTSTGLSAGSFADDLRLEYVVVGG